jgi:glycosyltransferase involved in cell wall biosynthesis
MTLPPAILQILPKLVTGGVERGTLEIAEAQIAAGFRALVASSGGPLVPALERLGAQHIALPLDSKVPWVMWRNAARLTDLVKAEGVRIIHARSRAPAWSGLIAARRSGARFVTTYHGSYNENFWGKRLYNSVMARGDRVIAISRHIEALILARHEVDPSLVRVIPRGVDPRAFDPHTVTPAQVAALRASWGVAEGRPIIMLPGRITRWKGQEVLVRAMAKLEGNAIALLVGDRDAKQAYATALEADIAAAGLGDRVRLVGHADDMATALMAADVVVHASIEAEAFGRTVIEAQAMARPVIAADLGGPRETVEEGATGWRVPAGDVDALAEALAYVLALPALARASIGRAARAAVLARYSTQAMQAATIAVYRELM